MAETRELESVGKRLLDMDCSAYREAISAEIDGEAIGLEPQAVTAHVAACPACRAWSGAWR